MCAAGVVVLLLTVWPDMGRQVGGWIGYRSVKGVGTGGYAMKFDAKQRVRESVGREGSAGGMVRMRQGGKRQRQRQEEVRVGGRKGTRMIQDGPAGRQEQIVMDDTPRRSGPLIVEQGSLCSPFTVTH